MARYDKARKLIASSFAGKTFVSQSLSDWSGEFALPGPVAEYYHVLGPVDVAIRSYGKPSFLPALARLWNFQEGYRYDGQTHKRRIDWDDDWLVVADAGGDPFIYARASGEILHAHHGAGSWSPVRLFEDIEQLVTALLTLGAIVGQAGDDVRDLHALVREQHRASAQAALAALLGDELAARQVLERLEWAAPDSSS